MATQSPPPDKRPDPERAVKEVELLKVVITREGKQVSASWAIHPQMKHDLLPAEWIEVSDLMTKVTGIAGTRFSEVLSTVEPDQPGSA
ncbi:MAG: hypothetical protein ACREIS_07305 [Nitrospiraceae bacterium]